MPSERTSRRQRRHNRKEHPSNPFAWISVPVARVFQLLSQALNTVAIVLLAAVELLVKLLEQSGSLSWKLAQSLMELISAALVSMTKPFGGLVGRGKTQKGSSTSNALAWVGASVIVFFLSSLISVIFPAQLSNPGWHAGVLRAFVGNGGLFIFGLFCLCLGQAWPSRSSSTQRAQGRRRNIWLGRGMATLYLLILPAFSYISFLTWKQVGTNARNQLVTIHQRRDEGLRQIAAASDPAPLRDLLQASGTPQPAATSLDQIKQKASDAILKSSIVADEETGKQRRQAQLGTLIEWVRMLISSFSLAVGSLALAKWASHARSTKATQPPA